jgi:hypothetical protein
MKARHRKHKASGGTTGTPSSGVKDYDADLKTKPVKYTGGKPEEEAMQRRAGGKVHGKASHRADRKPRKSGGRAGSDSSPFSSARNGTAPAGHKAQLIG